MLLKKKPKIEEDNNLLRASTQGGDKDGLKKMNMVDNPEVRNRKVG